MSGVGTVTLTDFLLARISDDEQVARRRLASWGDAVQARVLADCEAKREIVERWKYRWGEAESVTDSGLNQMFAAQATGLNNAIRFLAAVYADHPDYQDEWRP